VEKEKPDEMEVAEKEVKEVEASQKSKKTEI